MPHKNKNLEVFRNQIDSIDQQILDLLVERGHIVKQVTERVTGIRCQALQQYLDELYYVKFVGYMTMWFQQQNSTKCKTLGSR